MSQPEPFTDKEPYVKVWSSCQINSSEFAAPAQQILSKCSLQEHHLDMTKQIGTGLPLEKYCS